MSVTLVPHNCVALAHFAKAQGLDVVAWGGKVTAPDIARILWRTNVAAYLDRYGHIAVAHDIARNTRLGYRKALPIISQIDDARRARQALESFNYQCGDLPGYDGAQAGKLAAAIQRRIDAIEPPTSRIRPL